MPQAQLPLFPHGTTILTSQLAFECRNQTVYYFSGHLSVFSHAKDDVASFRVFTSQLVTNGTASQGDIVRAFGVSLSSVKRACKVFREYGSAGFYEARPKRRGSKLTPEMLKKVQSLLDAGHTVPSISDELGVISSTLHKAIKAGRLVKKKSMKHPDHP